MNLSNFNLSFSYSSITSQSHPLLTTSFKSGYFCYRTTSTAIPMNETNKKKTHGTQLNILITFVYLDI